MLPLLPLGPSSIHLCLLVCWGGVPPLWCRRSHLEDQVAMLEVWTQNGEQRMKIGVPVLGISDSKRCPRYSQRQVLRILKGQWVNDSGAKLRSPFPLKFSIRWIFLGFWRHALGEWEDYFPFLVGYDMWWYISRMPNIDGLQMSPLHIFSTKPHMMPTNLNQYFPRFGFDSEQNMQPWTWMAFASCFVNYDVGFKHIVSPKAGNLSSTVCDIFELNLIDPNPIDHSFASVRCCKFLVIHEVLTISTVSDVCPSIVGVPKLDWLPWVRCTTPADWTSSQALGGEIVFADICCFSENISWIYGS